MVPSFAMLWVILYTAGLTDAQKASRRLEIRSDLYEEVAFAVARGQGSAAVAGSVASRTVRGMAADVLWRLEEGRTGEEIVRAGASPPLPWITMWFVAAVIVFGGVASTQAGVMGDGRVTLAILAAFGAGFLWLGLYLTARPFLGPLCIAAGTSGVALGLWWTVIIPVMAVCAGVSALRRAQRIEAMLSDS